MGEASVSWVTLCRTTRRARLSRAAGFFHQVVGRYCARRTFIQLVQRFPGTQFSFLPGDITAQILNFGLPSPIDVQVSGRDLEQNFAYATEMAAQIRKIAGTADVRIQQIMDQPTLRLVSNRSFGLGIGLTESLIADNVLATPS